MKRIRLSNLNEVLTHFLNWRKDYPRIGLPLLLTNEHIVMTVSTAFSSFLLGRKVELDSKPGLVLHRAL